MRLAYFGAVLAAAGIATGCGGGGDDNGYGPDEKAVAGVVADLSAASRDGDGQRICSQVFAAALAENVKRASKHSCATEVQQNLPADGYDLSVDTLKVSGATATVDVTVSPSDAVLVPGQTDDKVVIVLSKEGDSWRVLRIADS